jgi:hypothetical protein
MELKKVVEFNQDQIQTFCNRLIDHANYHDISKFSEIEYQAFVDSRDTLRAATDGTDEDYQRNLKSDAIQHHITRNPHHPEYWDALGKQMPIDEAIIMYCDWKSRSVARGTEMSAFWDYNTAKLANQPLALAVVTALRELFND